MYEMTVPQFRKMLLNLKGILEIAVLHSETKNYKPEILLHSRLAPDQFPLIRQVQIACDTAKSCLAKVSGKEAPVYEDNEENFQEILERIKKTIDYLDSFNPNEVNDYDHQRKITQPRWQEKYLYPLEYVLEYAIPNFYFHVTTAYSILRHNGIDIGKKNYLGEISFKK